jgi:hypothetical protein
LLTMVLTAVTPLVEKNPVKVAATSTINVPMVFSMARVIVLAFAVAMVRRVWLAGVAGWPEATLSIGVVLAMPMLSAMDRADPEHVIELAKMLVTRFGAGEGAAPPGQNGSADSGVSAQADAVPPSAPTRAGGSLNQETVQ